MANFSQVSIEVCTVVLIEDSVNKKKQIFQMEHKLLRIQIGMRLTSWLFTRLGRSV